jgi:hypothetical protein
LKGDPFDSTSDIVDYVDTEVAMKYAAHTHLRSELDRRERREMPFLQGDVDQKASPSDCRNGRFET